MKQERYHKSPLAVMLMALALAVAMSLASLLTVLNRPIVDLPDGAALVAVGDMTLLPSDRIAEPDQLGTYPKIRDFLARQTLIAAQLEQSLVTITYATPQGTSQTRSLAPRPTGVTDLPFPFWFQQGVGILALVVAGWVLSYRRKDWGAIMFALTGFFLAVSAMAAATYSTRQIALPGDHFRILSAINHLGAGFFGIALVGLFLMYPRPLVRPIWLLLPLLVFSALLVLDISYIGTNQWLNVIVVSQMLIAIILGIIQWRRTSANQVDRAGLRWFLLLSLVGCSLFICLSVLPPVLGLAEEGYVSQAYAFGMFNLMHIGLALGVLRWRVFDLDRYAYHVWLWLAGALLIFATDLLLLLWLREQPLTSLALAIVIAGFLYFPVRQFLLIRLLSSKNPHPSERITEVFEVALAPTDALRDLRWDALLKEMFSAAGEVKRLDPAPEEARLADNGLALDIPALTGLGGRQLHYADGGRRLFNSGDVQAAAALCRMFEVARDSHRAYERGVSVERDRISRDVHDNIGAQLLSALHTSKPANKDSLLRETLSDLRQIISDGFSSQSDFNDVAADLRAEMAERLEIHGIALEWDTSPDLDTASPVALPYLLANHLRSILREMTSNIIKHANATTARVSLTSTGDSIHLSVSDNGATFDPETVARGAGLDNLAARVTAMNGQISYGTQPGGKGTRIMVPLSQNRPPEPVRSLS